jgi:hypothetical protein
MVMARKSHNGRAFPFVCDSIFNVPGLSRNTTHPMAF